MGKKKNNYTNLCEEIASKVKKNGSKSHSNADLVAMTHTLVNTPEHEVEILVKDGDKGYNVVAHKPVERYRNSLKPVLKTFGIDKDEAEKIMDVPFSKEHAEAIVDLSKTIVKDYVGTGRKLVFPVTSENESQMSISQVEVEEKVTKPNKIVKDEKTGEYTSVPTGKTVKTKAHLALKASNKVPGWLKSEI